MLVVRELTPAVGHWPFQVPPTPCPCLPVSCQSPAFPTIEVVEKEMETSICRSLTARQLLADTISFLSLQPCFEPPPPPPTPPGTSNPTASFTTGNKGSETLCQLLMVPELVGPLA